MSTRRLRVGATGAVMLAALALATIGAGSAAAAGSPAHRPGRMLIVAVPDLRWSDVAAMPRLRALATESAVGELSVKSLARATTCSNGLLVMSAGRRVTDNVPSCILDTITLNDLRLRNLNGRFAARLGAFGQTLHDAGLSTATVGLSAGLLLGDDSGQVDVMAPDVKTALDDADVVAVVLPALYAARDDQRADIAREIDARLAAMLSIVPADVPIAVVGTSDGQFDRAHLHVVVLSGRAWGHGRLTSVHRLPYVQLADLAPTFLTALGLTPPRDIDGQATVTVTRTTPTFAAMADDDVHARLGTRLGGSLRNILWFSVAGVAFIALGALRWPLLAWPVRFLGWPLAFAPVMSFAVQLVPWWRWGTGTYLLLVAASSIVLGAVAALLSRWLSWPGSVVLLPAAFTFTVLILDQFASARLQLSAPLGDSPLIAGRFRGMGNTDFALMAASALLVASVIGARLAERRGRRAALAAVAGVGVLAILVDGLPMLGDDFGGMLALLPVFALLAAGVAGVALTPRRLLLGLAVVVVAVTLLAMVDYLRPAAQQTHIGRFVGQLLHGSGGRVIGRKLAASLRSLHNFPAVLVVAASLAAIWSRRTRLFGESPDRWLAPGSALSLGMLAFLGSALNDSGVTVAAAVALASVPLLIAGLTTTPATSSLPLRSTES